MRAVRVSFVGEMGWELHVPKASCVPVYRALMGEGGVANAGYRAIDSLSIEKGYPHWHAEIRLEERASERSAEKEVKAHRLSGRLSLPSPAGSAR